MLEERVFITATGRKGGELIFLNRTPRSREDNGSVKLCKTELQIAQTSCANEIRARDGIEFIFP